MPALPSARLAFVLSLCLLGSEFASASELVVDNRLFGEATQLLASNGQIVWTSSAAATSPTTPPPPPSTAPASVPPPPSFSAAKGPTGVTPQGRPFGLGLEIGYPLAVTFKVALGGLNAIDGGFGVFSSLAYLDYAPTLALHVDYLWVPNTLATGNGFVLVWHVGIGGEASLTTAGALRYSFYSYDYAYSPLLLAARVPVGLDLELTGFPFEFFIEAAPTVLVFPSLAVGIGAGIGVRYYF